MYNHMAKSNLILSFEYIMFSLCYIFMYNKYAFFYTMVYLIHENLLDKSESVCIRRNQSFFYTDWMYSYMFLTVLQSLTKGIIYVDSSWIRIVQVIIHVTQFLNVSDTFSYKLTGPYLCKQFHLKKLIY